MFTVLRVDHFGTQNGGSVVQPHAVRHGAINIPLLL